jgi:hypothetical protein
MKERKRVTVSLSPWNRKQVQKLCELFNEKQTEIMRRALEFFYSSTFKEKNEQDDSTIKE